MNVLRRVCIENIYTFLVNFTLTKKQRALFISSWVASFLTGQGSGVKESLVFWTNVTAWLTWLEGTAEVRPAVTLTLADGSLGSAGGIDCALAPHTGLIRTALFIFAAGLSISGGSCTHANMHVKQTWCVTPVMDDIFFLPGENKSCFCSVLWQTLEKWRVCRTIPDFIRPHCLSVCRMMHMFCDNTANTNKLSKWLTLWSSAHKTNCLMYLEKD